MVLRCFLWLCAFGLFVVCPVLMNRSLARLKTLESSGKVIQAEVLSYRMTYGKHNNYYLTVSFPAGRQTITSEESVHGALYYAYRHKPYVPITTMADDPTNYEVGRINEGVIASTRHAWLATGGRWAVIVLFFILFFEVQLDLERKLLRFGEGVDGEITNVQVRGGKSTSTVVSYRYPTPLGLREGKGSISGKHADDFPIGGTIPVVFSRQNDQKSLAVPLAQVAEVTGAVSILR